MRVSEIRVKQVRVNQGLGVLCFQRDPTLYLTLEMRSIILSILLRSVS